MTPTTTMTTTAPKAGETTPQRPPLMEHPGLTPSLLFVLGLLAAIAPFATDMYLPTLPTMAKDLATSASGVQLTLTGFLAGVALGQLVFGPLSDRLGRRLPLVGGALVCVVASGVAALAPNLAVLIAARFVQGFTGAAGMVIGRAVISDVAEGRGAARGFNLMMVVVGVAPIVAPLAGSLLAAPLGWRGILWTVCGLATLMLIGSVTFVRESHPRERREHAKTLRTEAGSVVGDLRSRAFIGNLLVVGFAFAALMAYISASPFVFQVMAGISPVGYALIFGGGAFASVITGVVSARLTASHAVDRLLRGGLAVFVGATLAFLALALLGVPALWFALPLIVSLSGLSFVLGNATSLALAAVPRASGTASAIIGALQFALGATVSPLVSIAGEHTAVPFAVIMTTAALVSAGAFVIGRPQTGAQPHRAIDGGALDERAGA